MAVKAESGNPHQRIRRIARKARTDRLSDHGYTPETEPAASPLLGHCHINARTLAKYLHDAGFEPYIRWGAVMYPGEDYEPPETIKEAEKLGTVHFWVELQHNGEWWTVDLAQEREESPGELLVTAEIPDTYFRFPRSLIEFHPDVGTRDLRNQEGYRLLESRGYVVENPE